MKFKKLIVALGLTLTVDLSIADVLDMPNLVDETNSIYEEIPNPSLGISNFEELKNEEITLEEFNEIISSHKTSFRSMSSYATPDNYEHNDDIPYATDLNEDFVLKANLHNTKDMDYYKIKPKYRSPNTSQNTAVLLNTYSTDTEFTLYLLRFNSKGQFKGVWRAAKTSPYTLSGYLTIDDSNRDDTYYAVVFNKTGTPYSMFQNSYQLYYGNFERQGQVYFTNSNIKIDFGTYSNYVSKPQIIHLSNYGKFPSGSIVTSFKITNDGTGNFWYFRKIVNNRIAESYYQGSYIQKSDNVYIESPIRIYGYVGKSSNFVWQPRISFSYVYYLNPENMHYVFKP